MAKSSDGTIYFDAEEQKKVDEIVRDRLARHKPDDYDDLKELSTVLEDFEAYKGLSTAEKKKLLKEVAEETSKTNELKQLQQMEEEGGLTPAQAKQMKFLEDSISKIAKTIEEIAGERQAEKTERENKKKAEEAWNKQLSEFKESYADINLEELNKDADFIEYAEGRGGTLKAIYEGYVKLTSRLKEKTADEVTAKYKAKEQTSTGTGKGGGKEDTGEYGLTANQKNLAKKAGMSYKEYAERLKDAE